MSQPHSNNFSNHPYGTGSYSSVQQERGTNVGMLRSTQPLPQARGQFQNLPADVKLPPSFSNSRDNYNCPHVPPRSIHQVPHPLPNSGYPSYTNTAPVGMGGGDKGISNQSVGVVEIVRLLEETEAENAELKQAINENNRTLDKKLQDLESLAEENKVLKGQLTSSTNQFFEARVAVLGFKCRVMQLQAQGGSVPKHNSPSQQLGPHEINAQVATLTQEKKKVLDENKSLEAVITAEREKLHQLEDKKKIVEEERERLQTKVEQLESEMRLVEGQLGEAQSHSFHEHSTRNQMSQQVKALERENQELRGQVQNLMQTNTRLQSQVQALKSSEKTYAEQVHKLQHTAPVPKRRTNIQTPPASTTQDAEVERLKAEIEGLRKKVAEEKKRGSTLESLLNKKGSEYHDLMMKYNESEKKQQGSDQAQHLSEELAQLSEELAQLKMDDGSKQHALTQKDMLMQKMTAEKNELQSKVASLEKQKQEEVRRAKDDRDGIIANLEEKLRLANAAQSVSGVKSGSSGAMARRLNDALGKVKELETKLAKQVANYEEDRGQWEKEKHVFLTEVEQLQTESGDSIDHIVERLEHYEERTKQLEKKEVAWTQEKTMLEASLSQKLGSQDQIAQQLANLQEEFDEKSQEAAELRAQLENVDREKKNKTSKLQALSNEYTVLKENAQLALDRQKDADVEKKKALEETRRLSLNVQQLTESLERLTLQKKGLESTVSEYQSELTSLMPEYQARATSLHNAEAELERLSIQNRQLKAELEEKTKRVSQVESQRTRIQERLTHMDVQLKAYQEDFERERQAREAAVKVKSMVEERIVKKEKEVKELRDKLNQQAMHTLNVDDQYEESTDANQGRSGRGRVPPSESRSLSPALPQGRSAEQARLATGSDFQTMRGGDGEYRQRSQEQQKFSGTPPNRFSHEQVPPPLPPREKSGGLHGYPLQSGGPGQLIGGPPGTLQGGGHQGYNPEPWTQQFPVSTQQSGFTTAPRARPMTTAQPGSRELATVGSGELTHMGGFQHQPSTMAPQGGGGYSQQPLDMGMSKPAGGGGYSQQPLDMGIRRPPERRNNFSDPPTPRNNFSGPQGRNNLDMPPGMQLIGGEWVGPGEVMNKAPPSMACPICGQQSFQTQTDLELHCAQCT